jgi:menaquinone-specific isochorismate synthase
MSATAVPLRQLKIAPREAFSWLKAMPLYPKIYWANRERSRIVAAVGIGEEGSSLFAFRPFCERVSPEWSEFLSLGPFSPRMTLSIQGDAASFTGSLHLAKQRCPLSPPPFHINRVRHVPSQEHWIQSIGEALSSIRQGALDKIVLARKVELECETAIDPIALCQEIDGPGRTVFLFQPSPACAFLGASPERLYRRIGNWIECDAMAGTCPKGEEAALLKSEKDALEFRIVKERLLETLAPFCRGALQASATSIRSTPAVSHLYSQITGELKEGVQDSDLLDALHPTAAVGGWPKSEALGRLLEVEPFARGLYAAPIGWQSPEEAEFAVALRSCLVQGSRASLFAGTGIVEGSDPLLEWEESRQKMADWNRCFKSKSRS